MVDTHFILDLKVRLFLPLVRSLSSLLSDPELARRVAISFDRVLSQSRAFLGGSHGDDRLSSAMLLLLTLENSVGISLVDMLFIPTFRRHKLAVSGSVGPLFHVAAVLFADDRGILLGFELRHTGLVWDEDALVLDVDEVVVELLVSVVLEEVLDCLGPLLLLQEAVRLSLVLGWKGVLVLKMKRYDLRASVSESLYA